MTEEQNIARVEALLFVAAKPLRLKEVCALSGLKTKEASEALEKLLEICRENKRGVALIKSGESYQMVSSPEQAEVVKAFIKDETTGDLSKPSFETLTIIAYRGPVSKLELDRIRGVNCGLILRNLLLRGLIETDFDKEKKETYYTVSLDFVKFLGLGTVEELPDFERLHADDTLDRILADKESSLV